MTETNSMTLAVAAEMRAWMARRQYRQVDLAERLGVSQMWVSRHMSGSTAFTVDDLVRVAEGLGCQVSDLFNPRELVNANAPRPGGSEGDRYGIRDSNPEPAD